MIKHDFVSMLQPTNHSCTQTATAMLLSSYDKTTTVDKVLEASPTQRLDDGSEAGSSMQQLAVYCLEQGYNVELYSFDSMILDFNWRELSKENLVERLKAVKKTRVVSTLGKRFTELYVEEYIQFLQNGGLLKIQPYPTKGMLTELLQEGPLCVALNYETLYGRGHSKSIGLRQSLPDDTDNDNTTHVVLVYGQDKDGNFLLADPWGNPTDYTASSDQLIAAIMAAQWLCDNIFFRIVK